MYVLPLLVQLLIHSVSKIISAFASCRMVVSFSSPFPAYQPTPEGPCHVAMYFPPDLQLLVIMIEYDRSLSTHLTVWVFTFPHCCKFAKDRTVSYTDLCKNDILHLSRLFSKVLSGLTPALARPTSFRHRISSSILFVFLLPSHVRLLQSEA